MRRTLRGRRTASSRYRQIRTKNHRPFSRGAWPPADQSAIRWLAAAIDRRRMCRRVFIFNRPAITGRIYRGHIRAREPAKNPAHGSTPFGTPPGRPSAGPPPRWPIRPYRLIGDGPGGAMMLAAPMPVRRRPDGQGWKARGSTGPAGWPRSSPPRNTDRGDPRRRAALAPFASTVGVVHSGRGLVGGAGRSEKIWPTRLWRSRGWARQVGPDPRTTEQINRCMGWGKRRPSWARGGPVRP